MLKETLLKVRFALIALSLATTATASFASTAFHISHSQEEGVTFVPSHLGNTVSREDVQKNVLVAQQDGSLHWISRGYPASYPLINASVSTKSRQQVLDELQSAQKLPTTTKGVRDLGGEIGWVEAHQAP